ncbi:cilia- and flagella-associated protein 300 [Aulostomus maculatus]
MAGEKAEFETSFSFGPLPSRKFSFLREKDTVQLLMKWSMLGRMSAHSFSFDRKFHSYLSESFAQCFFRDASVVASLTKMDPGAWGSLDNAAVCVDVEEVPCTKVSMDLFDPIYSCGIVTPSGRVVKCYHDVHPDYDQLRQMLQEEDSENYCVVGRAEREEFLFRLFKHLVLGGELCQYEDTIEPYIRTTRQIYKDLIGVQKDPETKGISVFSTVLKVSVHDESGGRYPGRRQAEQSFAYLIVDPFKQHVTLFYHCYGVGIFSLLMDSM